MGWRRAAQLGRGWPHSSRRALWVLCCDVRWWGSTGIESSCRPSSHHHDVARHRVAPLLSSAQEVRFEFDRPLCSKSVRRWGCRFAHCAPDTTTRPPPPRSVARSTAPLACFGRRTSPFITDLSSRASAGLFVWFCLDTGGCAWRFDTPSNKRANRRAPPSRAKGA